MNKIVSFMLIYTVISLFNINSALAVTNITFWHAMAGSAGQAVDEIVDKFNHSQNQYHIQAIYKGNYPQTLTATVAAFRAGKQPDIVQVFEIGTATMINPKGIIVPVYKLMKDANIPFDQQDIIPAIRYYYANRQGNLLAMPFNSSSAVLYYNKAAYKKAGIKKPPKTWPQMAQDSKKILAAGYKCGFTTAWPSWIQLETFSAWHNLPFATDGNGFNSLDSTLIFNNPEVIHQVASFAKWQKQKIFQYGGRQDDARALFGSGDCAMLMESSGSRGSILAATPFPVGVAPLPYWPNIQGAPQNTVIGGAALWALTGHTPKIYKGIAEFFAFLMRPKIQMFWQAKTGYVPITRSAYQLSIKSGYYKRNQGADIAVKELLHKSPTPYSRGFRLGNYMRIRQINNQALEAAWSGMLTSKQAIDNAVQQGDNLLRQFQTNVSVGK